MVKVGHSAYLLYRGKKGAFPDTRMQALNMSIIHRGQMSHVCVNQSSLVALEKLNQERKN
jgi:hypothetical protein